MSLLGPAPEFTRVEIAMNRVMRDATEAAGLLHPVYGYEFKTIPEERAEDLASKLEECARFLRRHVAEGQKQRETRHERRDVLRTLRVG